GGGECDRGAAAGAGALSLRCRELHRGNRCPSEPRAGRAGPDRCRIQLSQVPCSARGAGGPFPSLRMSKRGKLIGATVAGVALLVIAGLGIASQRESGAQVRTEVVQRRDLVSVVTANGVIQPTRKVDISADVSGRVVELAVVEGQTVERGDFLLRIDPT